MSQLRPMLTHKSQRATTSAGSRSKLLEAGPQLPLKLTRAARTFATNLINGLQEEASNERVEERDIVTEMESSYLAYAMSVLLGRSLPDVRDGLKPVHRRILYGMYQLRLSADKPHKKCARVVGEVLGKFHPHGDTAVYNAMVRMAQDFSMRYTLVDGHGNFGSVDHDPPAAMRYTECRLRPLSSEMMLDHLEEDTVDFMDTFDASEREPMVLPAKVPQLLINGSQGIAVGMATQIPPHNLHEVVLALKALIKDPEISIPELMTHIPAPDFPTGGEILKTYGLEAAYATGRGGIVVRGTVQIEATKGKKSRNQEKSQIVISELPYNTNKAKFVQRIAKLVDDGVLEGISDVMDESDRDGMRVVVEVKKGAIPEIVLNNLYKQTALQSKFSCNMTAVVNGQPLVLNLKQFLEYFLEFRKEVVKRRSHYLLEKALERSKLVDGLVVALEHVEEVVKTLRESPSAEKARRNMMQQFQLNKEQAMAVAAMPLSRLTIGEVDKMAKEKKSLKKEISRLEGILSSPQKMMKVIESEANQIVNKHGDERRTRLIEGTSGELQPTDIIPNDPMIITFSKKGYIKRVDPQVFSVQNRGGKGVHGAKMRGDDTINEVLHVRAHDKVLFFSSDGRVFSVPAFEIPKSSRTAAGSPITSVLPGLDAASVTSIFVLDEETQLNERFLLMATKNGMIKRTSIDQFCKILKAGLIAIRLNDGDELRFVQAVSEDVSILIASDRGFVNRFNVDKIRATGRATMGVKSMSLENNSEVVGIVVLPHGDESDGPDEDEQEFVEGIEASIIDEEQEGDPQQSEIVVPAEGQETLDLLMVTAKGTGKRTNIEEFAARVQRVGKGCIGIRLRKGDQLVSIQLLSFDELSQELLLASKQGMMTRIKANSIRRISRRTFGVKVMNMNEGDTITSVISVVHETN